MKQPGIDASRALRASIGTLAMMLVVACGGGGGGGNVRPDPPPAAPPPEPPPLPPPPPPAASQPKVDDHLRLINFSGASSDLNKGAGVTIGLLDSGVRRDHPTLIGRVTRNFVHLDAGNDLSVDDKIGHGTTVAQLAAGRPFGQWPGGVAQSATIVSSRIISDAPPKDDGTGQGGNEIKAGQGYGDYFRGLHDELANAGARIINNSWGGLYWNDPALTTELAAAYRDFIVNRNGLIVFANGNSGHDPALRPNPSDNAALPSMGASAVDLERGWLTVGALDTLNPTRLADYSQACGIAMNYCLVAPGFVAFTGLTDTSGSPTYWVGKGTSFAAPLVSGAAAVVWSKFPSLSNDSIRQILLGTATDLGAAGVDSEFGWGLLNVGKALNGPATLAWGNFFATPFPSTEMTFSNPISGSGNLVMFGSGKLTLTQPATYTGTTAVTVGTLVVQQGLANSTVSVNGNGTLVGSGTFGKSVYVIDNGRVNVTPENPMRITGDYQQVWGTTLGMWLGSPLMVGGTATLNGVLTVMGVKSGYTTSSKETVLTAAGGVIGQFAGFNSNANVFLDATLGKDANNVFLNINRISVTSAAQSMGLTPVAVSSAQRVETAFGMLDESVATTARGFIDGAGALQHSPNAAVAERTLASLSGELHAADTAFATMTIDGNRHALASHLDGIADGPLASAWAEGLRGARGLSHFDVQSNGWVIGHDRRATEHLTVGAAMSETASTAYSDRRNDRERNRQVEGQLYAAWNAGGHYVLGRGALGYMKRNIEREVFLGMQGFNLETDYSSRYDSLSLETGHRVRIGGDTFMPYAGVQSTRLQRGAFSEAGAVGFGLSSQGSRWQANQALLGLRFRHAWDAGFARIVLQGRAEWQRMLSQSGNAIDARFTGIDAWSPIAGDALDRDVRVFGFGIESRWKGGSLLQLTLDGRHEFGTSYQQAMLRWSKAFQAPDAIE